MSIGQQIGRTPISQDIPYFNYSGNAIPAQTAVILDGTNILGTVNNGYGCALPAGDGVPVLGITVDNIPANSSGRVQVDGIAVGIASGAVTAGSTLMVDATTRIGGLKTKTSGHSSVGMAQATVADGDPCPVLLRPTDLSV